MIKHSKLAVLKVLMGVLILCVFQMYGFSRFMLNGTDEAFTEQQQPVIKSYVMEGAGYFLKSQADTLLLLNKIELSDLNGLNYTELQQLLNNAIINMENARAKYTALTQTADTATYQASIIDRLTIIDYYSFQQTNGLNSVIFNQAVSYFNSGDIRGLYHKILSDTQAILDKLTFIKSYIDTNTLPQTSYFWRLNQSYSDTLLSGQYAAEIFYNITGKN